MFSRLNLNNARRANGRSRKQKFRNNRGSSLPVVVIIITILMIVSTTALNSLLSESRRIKMDYMELAAQSTAFSGIELAKRDVLGRIDQTGSSEGEKMQFQYGGDYFPNLGSTRVKCNVTVYPHADRLFFESNAIIVTGSEPEKMIMVKTVKTVVMLDDGAEEPQTAWRVSD